MRSLCLAILSRKRPFPANAAFGDVSTYPNINRPQDFKKITTQKAAYFSL